MSGTDKSGPTRGPYHWHDCGGHAYLVNGPVEEPGQRFSGAQIISDGSAGGEYGAEIDVEGPDGRLLATSWDFYAACTPDRLAALHGLITYVSATHPDEIVRAALLADGRVLLADLRAAMGRVEGEGVQP